MGGILSNNGGFHISDREVMNLKEKVNLLQEEIKGMIVEREKVKRNCERGKMVLALKEAEWNQERKKLREEVMQMRKMMEEKEEKMSEMKEKMGKIMVERDISSEKECELMGTKLLVQKMKEERARRDGAVEKWKQLYLAIKTELDGLIQRTYDGNGLYWKAEEKDVNMENMKKELQEKEGAIKTLKAQLDSLEKEKMKKDREFDLLRQSLRIMNGRKSSIQKKEKLLRNKHGR